jgi:hypothetical protein
MLLQLCRRTRIHSDIPIVMFVAITNALRTADQRVQIHPAGIDDCSEPQHSGSMAITISASAGGNATGTVGVGLSVPAAAGLDEGGVRSRVIDDARRSHSEPPGSLSELSQFLAEGLCP